MFSRKIVAVGGGENGRLKEGNRLPYETGPMDEEIVRLTGKKHPNFLLLAHSQPLPNQEFYFTTMRDIYGGMYGCDCKDLKSDKLTDNEYVKEIIDWADIIYEGGGDTAGMIMLWKETGFDKFLRGAWESGKVMCGVSAGGNCWFNKCSSDALSKYGDNLPLIKVNCLGFVNGLFVPHADEPGRQESVKELLEKEQGEVGLLLSNCAALEIVDNGYRVITSPDATNHGLEKAFGKKTYRKDGEYIEENIEESSEFKKLSELYLKS